MFERFTREARATVVRAQEEARALHAGRIGTEHLLLGVAGGDDKAARTLAEHGATRDALLAQLQPETRIDGEALAAIGIDLDEIRRRVEASFGPGALERGRPGRGGHVPLTPPAKKALELALREALAAGDKHIGAEHVVLGLLRDERAGAVALVRRAGADPAQIRAALGPAGGRRGRAA